LRFVNVDQEKALLDAIWRCMVRNIKER
jgi:hypothetical protein